MLAKMRKVVRPESDTETRSQLLNPQKIIIVIK